MEKKGFKFGRKAQCRGGGCGVARGCISSVHSSHVTLTSLAVKDKTETRSLNRAFSTHLVLRMRIRTSTASP